MKLPLFQIDAFANKPFEGNPAAIVPLQCWLPDHLMQAIAEENNLAETAFYIETNNRFHIRWFTPSTEVDLCGHATLACAFVIWNSFDYEKDTIEFDSRSGLLSVRKDADLLTLNFPSQPPIECETPREILSAFDKAPIECLSNEDYILVFENEKEILALKPNLEILKNLDLRGVAVTAQSNDYDFVARFFAPKCGIAEDPVTGSAYTQLMPYWSDKLGTDLLKAKQLSQRGGELICRMEGDRVLISGKAIKYLEGKIEI